MLLWVGFSLAIVLLLVVSRRDLALGMGIAAIVLAIFTHSFASFGNALWGTISDPSVLLLALVVGIIPLIGGVMEASGEIDRLVANLRIGIRPFLALGPGLLGMLPMPGGALLSAPLIERGAGHAAADIKAAANVWFRHALLLVYPLGPALIASAKIADLEVYSAIPYLIPAFLLTLGLGYLFLLRRVSGTLTQTGAFSLIGLLVPLLIILIAPILDLTLKRMATLPYTEIGTVVGVLVSLVMGMIIGKIRLPQFGRIIRKARPWKYMFIIVTMFAFLNVFATSGLPERIGAMALPPVVLCIVIGALLGLITGRIQAPMSIVVPIYVTTYGAMSAPAFAATYFAIYLGYILTPIHPCISVSLEYFKTSLGAFVQRLAIPTAAALLVTLVVGLFVF
jgi:integral membrane protein (TIGR00529 family)